MRFDSHRMSPKRIAYHMLVISEKQTPLQPTDDPQHPNPIGQGYL